MCEAFVNCESSHWHPNFNNVNVSVTNKTVGIDEFLRYDGIENSETMAFADGGNDIEILKHASIGVTMGNAGDDVKAVTDSVNDDGVANTPRHFGANRIRQCTLFNQLKIIFLKLISVDYYSNLVKSQMKFSRGYYFKRMFPVDLRYRIGCILLFTDFAYFLC